MNQATAVLDDTAEQLRVQMHGETVNRDPKVKREHECQFCHGTYESGINLVLRTAGWTMGKLFFCSTCWDMFWDENNKVPDQDFA